MTVTNNVTATFLFCTSDCCSFEHSAPSALILRFYSGILLPTYDSTTFSSDDCFSLVRPDCGNTIAFVVWRCAGTGFLPLVPAILARLSPTRFPFVPFCRIQICCLRSLHFDLYFILFRPPLFPHDQPDKDCGDAPLALVDVDARTDGIRRRSCPSQRS